MSDQKTNEWRKRLEQRLDELKALGAEVGNRVGATTHEVQRDAKDAWRELEPRLGEAEVKLREAADDAVEHLEGVFGELGKSLRSLQDKLRPKSSDD
ncbi:MAG: hypothetical protein AB1Z98_10075 [Nannocystaceae bacterium]